MIEVQWSNGKIDKAPTWEALEDTIRADQWKPYSPDSFRLVMQKRALRWSGIMIETVCSAAEFFRELQDAKLIVILDDGKQVAE